MSQYSAVIGAGTMGLGIAYVLALAGDDAVLVEPDTLQAKNALETLVAVAETAVSRGKLDKEAAFALLSRISVVTSIDELAPEGAALIIEAIPERMELKKAILRRIEDHCSPTVLASNTSGLSIDELATVLARPERFVGLHFFNPVWIMPLLEIVNGEQTDPTVIEFSRNLATRIGKESIVVRNMPGFATSRLGVMLGLEAMRMFEDGVASAVDIDKAMELGYRHPMGPLRLTDLVGLDVRLDVARHLERSLGPRFTPPQILVDKVAAGDLGKKTGKGFHDWS